MTSSFLLLFAVAIASSACVRKYRPPAPNEPHAVVKLRRVYETHAGVSLHERAVVEHANAFQRTSSAEETGAPANDAILVHPTPATIRFHSGFVHAETHMVTESYLHQVPYQATESYSCGGYKSYRTCSRSVTRYRMETRWRTVPRTVEVSDGECNQAVRIAPIAGRTYLLQYTYHGPSQCHLTCFEQSASAGTIEQRPCRMVTDEALLEAANPTSKRGR